jgi:hypothetical protein
MQFSDAAPLSGGWTSTPLGATLVKESLGQDSARLPFSGMSLDDAVVLFVRRASTGLSPAKATNRGPASWRESESVRCNTRPKPAIK